MVSLFYEKALRPALVAQRSGIACCGSVGGLCHGIQIPDGAHPLT